MKINGTKAMPKTRRMLRGSHISVGSIRRLARRGGVKRMSAPVYNATRDVLTAFLRKLIGDAIIYSEHSKRKTVMVEDVIFAMRNRGKRLYGFDDSPDRNSTRTSIKMADSESSPHVSSGSTSTLDTPSGSTSVRQSKERAGPSSTITRAKKQ